MANIPKECRCPKLFETLDKLDMSQKDLAEKIGASTGNVSDWLMGRAAPTRRRWNKIAEALNIPVEEIMEPKKEPVKDDRLEELIKIMYSMPEDERNEISKEMTEIIEKRKKKVGETK